MLWCVLKLQYPLLPLVRSSNGIIWMGFLYPRLFMISVLLFGNGKAASVLHSIRYISGFMFTLGADKYCRLWFRLCLF